MRYLAVYHHWWMDTGRFSSETIEANSLEDAETKAHAKAHRMDQTFSHCAAAVFEIASNECLSTRRLTPKERLTGKTERALKCLK